MGTVVVVGGVNQDLTVHVETRPRGGETVVGRGPLASWGGKGANQAVAAAHAGARVRLCAAVGSDPVGADAVESLRASGVDVAAVRAVPGVSTGMAFIVLTPDGENSIVVGAGANAELGAPDVGAALAEDQADRVVDVVLVQTEPGPEPVRAAAAEASRRSLRLVLNAAPVEDAAPEALALADPLVVNEHEARDMIALRGDDAGSVPDEHLAGHLRAVLGAPSVVVTLGASGAVVAHDDGQQHVPAPQVGAVDTTGAGDVFVGVVAARVADGWDLPRATRDACEAAARAVESEGARGYLDGAGG
jgi:ribokinase